MRFWKITHVEEGHADMYTQADTSDGAYKKLAALCGPVPKRYLKFTEIAEADKPETDDWI
jgi:hypothetical protein